MLLFAYGTSQDRAVQMANFGRTRVLVTLKSGAQAWVYVRARNLPAQPAPIFFRASR